MSPTTAQAAPQRSAPSYDVELLRRRPERMRASALRAGCYSTVPIFVIAFVVMLVENGTPQQSLLVHLFDSLARALAAAVLGGAAVAGAMWYATFVRCARIADLSTNGRLVPARWSGHPTIFGGNFMRYTVRGMLGAVWEPLAPLLAQLMPLFEVSYSFEVDGKKYLRSELFYGDEQVVTGEGNEAWVVVDRRRPGTTHYLARTRGKLQNAPFVVR
jgi:hypothetical protein